MASLLTMMAELERRPKPTDEELAGLVRSWSLNTAVTLTYDDAVRRVQQFYSTSTAGTRMTAVDLRKPVLPTDQGVGEAYGGACPWPECSCTHTYPCVKGWIQEQADVLTQEELEYGAKLRAEADRRGLSLQQGLAWGAEYFRKRFGPPAPAGSRVIPCPRCRGEQAGIMGERGVSHDYRQHQLRKRGAHR